MWVRMYQAAPWGQAGVSSSRTPGPPPHAMNLQFHGRSYCPQADDPQIPIRSPSPPLPPSLPLTSAQGASLPQIPEAQSSMQRLAPLNLFCSPLPLAAGATGTDRQGPEGSVSG